MIRTRIKADDLMSTLKNTIDYSSAYLAELNRNKKLLNEKVGSLSIDVFYEYLDSLARSHPGMLHHVYEWGQVGDPQARLFELTLSVNGTSAVIDAQFLESEIPADNASEPFYDKATVMEEGIPVTIKEVDAKALFFEIDGEEFFRVGPITIMNPGGAATRGSFVQAFNEFYGQYFIDFYLNSIKFYKYFSDHNQYEKYFSSAAKGSAASKGRLAAMSWIMNSPGGR
jgi:hypothetical protein